ncbi:MAG: hypothetical protein ABW170_04895 [Candidatus Thiodiazotropha sp. L084R]
MLRQITNSPYLNLLSGLILLVASAYEIAVTANNLLFGVNHGILVFSIIQLTRVFPEIMRGLAEIEDAEEAGNKS